MAAVVIDSPRWRDGWGEPLTAPAERPALRLVGDGERRVDRGTYRRRRLVLLAVAGLLVAAALAVASATLARPATAGSEPVGRQTHLVEAGETYWSIAAARHHGGGDLRVEVDQLVDANGGRALQPGDRIEVP